MSNSFIFSALTVVALTGTFLIHLKHEHDSENLHLNENTSFVDEYDEFEYEHHQVNPKMFNVLNSTASSEKFINKRSLSTRAGHDTPQQLSIDDKNLTQVDHEKRNKVREVKNLLYDSTRRAAI